MNLEPSEAGLPLQEGTGGQGQERGTDEHGSVLCEVLLLCAGKFCRAWRLHLIRR